MLHDDWLPLNVASVPIAVEDEAIFTKTPVGKPAATLSKLRMKGDVVN